MRILVTGGREYTDWWAVDQVLTRIWEHEAGRYVVLIHGAARGADSCAARWARTGGPGEIDVEAYPADWKRYGRGAGPVRNQQMLDEGKPDLVVAFPGGVGTADMVRRAKRAGVEVREIA